MKPVVEARAGAVIAQPSDRWRLSLQVHAHSSEPEAAYRRRTRAVATIQRVLEVLDGADLSGERIGDDRHPGGDQIIAGWSGTVSGSVDDVEDLRELISRLSGVADVEMHGPWWELSDQAQRVGRIKALELASRVARRDAETIARALGGSCGDLISVTTGDTGRSVETAEVVMVGDARTGGGENLPSRMLELALAPDDMDVHAQVAVSFVFVPQTPPGSA